MEYAGDNKVITSIARYYIYYHMKRFTEDPRKMDWYITRDIKELIKANLQTKTTWTDKFIRTRENISLWYQQHLNRLNIRNYRYRMIETIRAFSVYNTRKYPESKITAIATGCASSRKTATSSYGLEVSDTFGVAILPVPRGTAGGGELGTLHTAGPPAPYRGHIPDRGYVP